MFEEKIIQEIKSLWNNHSVGGDFAKVPELDIEDLRVVIETVFLASLKREEREFIDFSVALITQEEINHIHAAHVYGEIQKILRFPEPLPFNEESISKLANAFDKNTTALAIEFVTTESGKKYIIWGAMFYGPSHQSFFDIASLSGNGFYTERPNCLIVTTSSPGSFLLSRGPFVFGYFRLGKIAPSNHSPFLKGGMGDYIHPLINENPEEVRTNYGDVNLEALKYLLLESASRGHGATIILVPSEHIDAVKEFIADGYCFTGDLGISFLLKDLINRLREDKLKNIINIKRFITHRIGALAQLSAVDGALLITPSWEVIGFGYKITAEKWRGNILEGPEAFGKEQKNETIDTSKLGNRHNSTINFIGKCPGSIAFVISEDGPIRGLVLRDPKTVLFWKDCRGSSFVENYN